MKTQLLIRVLIPTFTVMAIGILAWQHSRIAQAQAEMETLRSENAQPPALREALAALQQIEIDHAELVRLRQSQASHQLELARARALAARTLNAEAEAAAARTQLEQNTTKASVAEVGIAAPMAEMTQGVLEQKGQRQLTLMQERLQLTPFQAEAIEQILNRRARGMAEAMKGAYSGRIDADRIAALRAGNSLDPESQILAILTPDQQAEYAQMRDEERAETALSAAHSEFFQMRSTLGLREDQQDQVFDILYAQSVRQFLADPDDPEPANPAEAMQRIMERKLEALEGVLTTGQLASYRQQQELRLGLLQGMMSQIQAASDQP